MPASSTFPFPYLQTERLQLRPLALSDGPEIFLLRSDKEHNAFIDRPLAESLADAESFIHRMEGMVAGGNTFFWVVTLKDSPTLVGSVLLMNVDREHHTAELGYELLNAMQGKGIMREAVAVALDFAFHQLKLEKIEAVVHHRNERSLVLLDRFNFKRDAELEKTKLTEEDTRNLQVFSLHVNDHQR